MSTMQSDRATLYWSLLFFTRFCAAVCDARSYSLFKRDAGQSTRAPFEDRQQMWRLLLLLTCFCSYSSRSPAFDDTAGLMIMLCIEELLGNQHWWTQAPSPVRDSFVVNQGVAEFLSHTCWMGKSPHRTILTLTTCHTEP